MDRQLMTLRGRYTLWDFIRAWNLYVGIGLVFRIMGVFLLLACGTVGGSALMGESRDYVNGVIFLAVPVFVLWWIFWRAPHRWRSPFLRKDDGLGGEIRLTQAGVRFMTQNSRRDWNWEALTGWSECGGCFLLRAEDMGFEFVPKHLFPDADSIRAFRILLEQHIVPRMIRLAGGEEEEKMNRSPREDEEIPVASLIEGVLQLWNLLKMLIRP